MVMEEFPVEDSGRFKQFLGPGQVAEQVHQAIQFCWMALPEDKRSLEEVEKQMRRIFERAIKNMREDGEAFSMK